MNVSDSERIAGFLEARGLKPAKDITKSDFVIFNTCGVRQTAEDRVYGLVHNLVTHSPVKSLRDNGAGVERGTKKPAIIVTGCLANRKDVQRKLKDKVDLFCEIRDVESIMYYVSSMQNKKIHNTSYIIHATSELGCNYLNISPKYTNTRTAYIPIMTGCNNFCSYCVVPYARGREVSRSAEDIIAEIDNLTEKKYKEVILLGQNVNSYNHNIKNSEIENLKLIENCKLKIENYNTALFNFPVLLEILANSYPKINFKFLTSHPKDFSNELINIIAKNRNINREIHLPVQAGSDKILKAMNRPYTQRKYLALIEKIKKKIPDASFTTDVIVGFPGETEKDFQETVKVFEKVKYNEAYINKYSPRPGTAAFSLGDSISWDEKKRREKVLRETVTPRQKQTVR
ncbi:MAG: tRNA ((37)-C2)-methylthiotransferase MiaB [Patescibacteria group bacterium]|nr:tRNA ((37)-C2)-methylthiotransferase MiaB [Patescibacteria group bacterium]